MAMPVEEDTMQRYFTSEMAASDILLDVKLRLLKYGLGKPKFDDSDRLRAYLVILDFDRKARNWSGWLLGFLICALPWSLSVNGWPFAWTSEAFRYFGWTRNTSDTCNLFLLIAFWSLCFLYGTSGSVRTTPSWNVSDQELDELVSRIRRMDARQSGSSAAQCSSGSGSLFAEEYDLSPDSLSSDSTYFVQASRYFGLGAEALPENAVKQQWRLRCDNGIDVVAYLACPQCGTESSVPVSKASGLELPASATCIHCHQTIWATS